MPNPQAEFPVHRLQARLEELRQEYQAGQALTADLEAQLASLRSSMLRISGAIQVLEELIHAALQTPVDRSPAVETEGNGRLPEVERRS
jgi:prefoldin subunit 5